MNKIKILSIFFLSLSSSYIGHAQAVNKNYDVVIYGATSAGVMAAVAAKQNGVSVILLSPEKHIGGLTTSGLGWTDIGNQEEGKTIGGLSLNFFQRVRDLL